MTHEHEMTERGLVLAVQALASFSGRGDVSVLIYDPQPDVLSYAVLYGSRFPAEFDQRDYYVLTFGTVKVIVCINTATIS